MRSEFVNSDSLRLLTSLMEYENGLALRVCIETGLRIGDVLKIKKRDLDGNKLHFVASKTGKSGTKEISTKLQKELERFWRSPDDFIFKGRGKSGHRTRQAVYLDLKRACERMGVEGQISPHSARKSYAVKTFHDKGLNAVQKELQHRNVSDTFLYCLSDLFGPKQNQQKEKDVPPSAAECPFLDEVSLHKIAVEIAEIILKKIKR